MAVCTSAERNQEWRTTHRAPRTGGGVRGPGDRRRRVRSGPPRAHDEQPSGTVEAAWLEIRLREPVQGRRRVRQHAAVPQSEMGNEDAGDGHRPRTRWRAPARVRHFHHTCGQRESIRDRARGLEFRLRHRPDRRPDPRHDRGPIRGATRRGLDSDPPARVEVFGDRRSRGDAPRARPAAAGARARTTRGGKHRAPGRSGGHARPAHAHRPHWRRERVRRTSGRRRNP